MDALRSIHADVHASCTGCSLCLLACPVWRQTRDIRLTPHGRAKALQHGASVAELGASISSCTLCGACEPACPEKMPLVDMILELRRQVPLAAPAEFVSMDPSSSSRLLLPGKALREDGERLARVAGLLDVEIAADDGSDIALALESGAAVPPARLSGFLAGLRHARKLIVAEGFLLRLLRDWLPGAQMTSLGEALSAVESVRAKLRASDLYIIEPRAYHGDHRRLVLHYDALRAAVGFATNLDTQRLAIPTTAASAQRRLGLATLDAEDQARWILEGRAYERVVVEDANDCAVFASVTDRPVVHLGDL
jgi:ferredoxin